MATNPTPDKIVTHADLPALLDLRNVLPNAGYKRGGRTDQIVDRLIAAAEADQPPLPEGWVLLRLADGTQRVLWHRDGRLSVVNPQSGLVADYFGDAEDKRDRLTPLRHTITEADLERAVAAHDNVRYASATECIRAVVKALGLEVAP